jgi:histidyl-tRNA synthetase
MGGDPAPAIALAESLRSAGLRVQLYGEQKKFKQKMAYADKLGVPFAVLLGEDEIAAGKCSVKNMTTGQQVTLTPWEAVDYIKATLDENNGPVILEK